MRLSYFFVPLVTLALGAGAARADGLLYKLPKDGTWATYQMDVKGKGEREDQGTMTVKGTLRLASVGQTVEDGQECRWIEVTWDIEVQEDGDKAIKEKEVYKVLIPEKFLAKGEAPLEHAVRAWEKREKGEPRKMKDQKSADEGPLPILLAGPLKDAKALPKTEVESKLGKLQCEGVTGTLEFKLAHGEVIKCALENRLHPDAPFGVVSARWMIESPRRMEGKMDWTMKLIDFGDKAVSDMPDAK